MEIDKYHLVNRMQISGRADLCKKAHQALQRTDGDMMEAQGDDCLAGAVQAWNHALRCLSIQLYVQPPTPFSIADIVAVEYRTRLKW